MSSKGRTVAVIHLVFKETRQNIENCTIKISDKVTGGNTINLVANTFIQMQALKIGADRKPHDGNKNRHIETC